MAEVYRRPPGAKYPTDKIVALTDEVQFELERVAFEVSVRAEALLLEHKQDGDARILTMTGDVDHYVVLDDSRGLEAAMSIEFGRAGYIDPETGQVKAAMEGLHILAQAANLPAKGRRLPGLTPYTRKQAKARAKKTKKKRGK